MQDARLRGVPEVAERLGISRATVRRLIRDTRIRSVRIGTRVLVSEAELARIAEQGTHQDHAR